MMSRKLLTLFASLLMLMLLGETFLQGFNFFALRRWIETDSPAIREQYLMPTDTRGIILFGDRYKPYRKISPESGRLHGWKLRISRRFDGDTDGKHRAQLDEQVLRSFHRGTARRSLGNPSLPFYTDYRYLDVTFFRNLALLPAGIAAGWFCLALRFRRSSEPKFTERH